ncbi:MAG: DUF1542 domain-containing protein [Gemmataceae bacterium]|nr:DUF1542 domain-containing protein [Gemmataceae bacterium]
MSGYDDRRRDDRDDDYDDRPRRRDDDRGDDTDDRPRRGGRAGAGREKVRLPAIFLTVVGGLGVAFAALGLIQLGQLPAQLDQALAEQNEKLDKDPNLTDDQKKQQKQTMTDIMGGVKKAAPAFYVVNLLVAAVVTLGGVQMLRLSGRGLPIIGSVLAMLPFVNGCCCLIGLPVGIWCLIVLSKPEVKAAFAARSAAPGGY